MSTTVSARRDGRTAATVPDDEVKGRLRDLFAERQAAGQNRPTWEELRGPMRGIDVHRAWALMREMEQAGELPALPMNARQQAMAQASQSGSLGYWAERHQRQCDEFAAGLKEVQKQKEREQERAFRGRPRPAPAEPTVRELARMVRAAERRLGLGARVAGR